MKLISVQDRVAMPLSHPHGTGIFYSFSGFDRSNEHFAVELGRPSKFAPRVRVHSECVTGDVFGSQRCDCGQQLGEALTYLAQQGGFILYLRQEGRGIGLYAKLSAYLLQDKGIDTFEANRRLDLPEDGRDYSCAVDMLKALGVNRVQLITNNPNKVAALQAGGIEIAEVIPTGVFVTDHNSQYLQAKVDLHHHCIDLPERHLHKQLASSNGSRIGRY